MLLILAHHYDAEAQWLYQTLSKKDGSGVRLLAPEALGLDYSISLWLDNSGRHGSTIFFYDTGTRTESGRISYVVNRLRYIDPVLWQQAEPAEKIYATSELNAFFPAFIESLSCPVSNLIHHGSLYGDSRLTGKWAAWLRRAAISVHPLSTDITGEMFDELSRIPAQDLVRFMYDDHTVFVPAMQQPAAGEEEIRNCLLRNGGAETLELIFLKTSDGLQWLYVSKTPSLSLYGDGYIRALSKKIKNRPYDSAIGNSQRATTPAAC